MPVVEIIIGTVTCTAQGMSLRVLLYSHKIFPGLKICQVDISRIQYVNLHVRILVLLKREKAVLRGSGHNNWPPVQPILLRGAMLWKTGNSSRMKTWSFVSVCISCANNRANAP